MQEAKLLLVALIAMICGLAGIGILFEGDGNDSTDNNISTESTTRNAKGDWKDEQAAKKVTGKTSGSRKKIL